MTPGACRVARVEYLGHDSLVTVSCGERSILVRTRADRWRPGDAVTLRVSPDAPPATAWPAP